MDKQSHSFLYTSLAYYLHHAQDVLWILAFFQGKEWKCLDPSSDISWVQTLTFADHVGQYWQDQAQSHRT